MDTFTLVKRTLTERADDPLNAMLDPETARIGLITTAVQTVVDALTPADGGRYIVGFQDISTAATSLLDRRVIVSSRPLRDVDLTMVEQAVVIVTFTAHEIGHTVITAPRKALIPAHNPHSGYHAVANLADDIILEPYMADRYPILRDAFEFTGLWVLRTTSTNLPRVERLTKSMTTAQRFNMLLAATRYDTDLIEWAPNAAKERAWGLDWKRRLIAARLTDHDTFLALCDEAWDRIRSTAEDEDEPPVIEEPPVGPVGPPEDDDDDETEPPVDGPVCPPPGGNETDYEDPDDEPRDPNDEPRDWDDDEPKGDEPKGGDSGPAEDHPDPDARTNPGEKGEGGGGNSAANADTAKRRDEDDFNPREVDKSTHDQSESDPWDYDARAAEQRARIYASSTITAFGQHGSMATTWE